MSSTHGDRVHSIQHSMLPFTHEQFLAVFADYNEAVWPVQVLAYLAAAAMCIAIGSRNAVASALVPCALAAMWLWTGISYHWLFFARVNAAASAFGAAFVAQAILLVLAAVRRRLDFSRAARRLRTVSGWTLIAYSALLYPAIGSFAGLHFPAAPTFGITPCPLTILSFGVFLLARCVPWWLLPIPTAWSAIGASAAWQLAIPQDWALLLSAMVALPILWHTRRQAAAASAAQLQSGPQ
jgi:hypothetical protein